MKIINYITGLITGMYLVGMAMGFWHRFSSDNWIVFAGLGTVFAIGINAVNQVMLSE